MSQAGKIILCSIMVLNRDLWHLFGDIRVPGDIFVLFFGSEPIWTGLQCGLQNGSPFITQINTKGYVGGIYFIGVGHSFIKFPRTVQTIEFSKDNSRNGLIKSRTSDGLEVNLEISY